MSAQLVLTICSAQANCPGFPVGSVQAPVDQNGWRNFKVTLTQNVTSFSFQGIPPSPAQAAVNIIFTQDATGGRTVTFAAGITSPCAVATAANATTLCQFEYDGTAGIWIGILGGGTAAAGVNKAGNPTPGIWVNAYGVTAPGFSVPDATTTLNSSTITCPNNDCNFTSSMVGWQAFVTSNATFGSYTCPQSTIATVNSAQSITLTAANDCTASLTATGVLLTGPDETTALRAADAAASAACAPLIFPAGYIFFTISGTPIFSTAPSNCAILSGGNFSGRNFVGQGVTGTFLVPLPNSTISGAVCTAGPLTNACMFGTPNGEVSKLTVWGGGNPGQSNPANVALIAFGASIRNYDFDCIGWYWNQGNIIGIIDSASNGNFLEGGSVGCGGVSFEVTGLSPASNGLQVQGGFFNSKIGDAMKVLPNNVLISIDNAYNTSSTLRALNIAGGTVIDFGSTSGCTGGSPCNGGIALTGATSVLYANGINTCTNSGGGNCTSGAGSNGIFLATAGAKAYVQNSQLQSPSAGGAAVNSVAGTFFFDLGGNTYGGGPETVPTVFAGLWLGTPSTTGTALVAGNVGFTSGWGTGPTATAISAYSDSHQGQFLITVGTTPGAAPVVTLTFPTAYQVAPVTCKAQQTGGTQANTFFNTGTITNTTVAFTYGTGTPTAGNTIQVAYECGP